MDENKLTIRKLTETECLRLMGFNDEEINRLKEAKDDRGKPMFSRTLLYQFAGNSVVVDCYKAIQEVILDDMENEGKPRPGTLEAWI
jgi:DNA (cytosine-5)-methyltransferase 1